MPISRQIETFDKRLSKTISHHYDVAGNRVQMVEPEGTTVDYKYDLAGRLDTMTRSGEVFHFAYDSGHRLTRLTLANGAFAEYSYDASNNLLALANRRSDGNIISSFEYDYDNAGNRIQLRLNGGDRINYTYDARNQLIQELRTASASAYDQRMAYDSVGNRTNLVVNGVVTSYSYDPADQLNQEVQGAITTNYTYDANGNQLSKTKGGSTVSYDYDVRDRLVGFTSPTAQRRIRVRYVRSSHRKGCRRHNHSVPIRGCKRGR